MYKRQNELSLTAKKPAIRSSPNVNYQTVVDAVSEVLDQRERDRAVNVNTVQNANCATTDNRNKKARPVRARQHLVIRRQEVHLAERRRQLVPFASRTR